jgi:hypothetical protein
LQKDGGGGGGPPESQEPSTDGKMTETSLALCYTSIIYYLFDSILIIMIIYLQMIEEL